MRASVATGLASTAVWAAALALCAWLASGWVWHVAAPATPALPPVAGVAEPASVAQAIAGRHLFGRGAPAAEAAPRFRLLGVMTGRPGAPGFAILAEDGRPPLPATLGEEFAPGVRLRAIEPQQVRIERGGREEVVVLVAPAASNAPPVAVPAASPSPAGAAAGALVPNSNASAPSASRP